MKFPLSLYHHNLYPNQWIISRLSLIPILLLTLHLLPSSVVSRDFDYFYHHRAYRQNIVPNLRRNQEQLPVIVEPSVDDYTVDNNYEATQFKLKSSDNSIAAAGGVGGIGDGDGGGGGDSDGDNLNSPIQGTDNGGGYSGRLDDIYSSSLRALSTDTNENINHLHQQQPQPLQANNQNVDAGVSSFVKHTPLPSSQLKASSFNVDSSKPLTMYAQASSSARIHTNPEGSVENLLFVGSVIGVTFIGIFLVVATGYFVHRINIQRKAAADIEYPAYGVVGPGASLKEKEAASSSAKSGTSKGSNSGTGGSGSLSPSGDRRLAQSAQMYHYHHQKQQMISSDKLATETGHQHPSTSEVDSEEEENEEGDYTVYECPGLASTGEMEVKNPLFQDDITPISSPSVRDTKQDGSSN